MDTPMATAYGNLIVRHQQAARAGDEPLRMRIYDAIELFAELWPEEAKAWEGLFGSPETTQSWPTTEEPMSKKPKLGGTVQISGRRYTVLIEPQRRTQSFWILVMSKDGLSYWAKSEGWRLGCGPWKIESQISTNVT